MNLNRDEKQRGNLACRGESEHFSEKRVIPRRADISKFFYPIPLIFLVLGSFVFAEPQVRTPISLNIERYTTEDGLSSDYVEFVTTDDQGFLWLGTRGGLNRFDGYEFRVWRHDPRDPDSLDSNWINQILVDQRGQLWISLRTGGLDRFDPVQDRFFHFRYQADGSGDLLHPLVSTLKEDSQGRIWVGTAGGGLYRFIPEDNRLQSYSLDPNRPASTHDIHVTSIVEDDNGQLWIGTANGLLSYDPDFDTLMSPSIGLHEALNTVPILDMAWEETLWIATSGFGLLNYDPKSDQSHSYFHPGGEKSDLRGFGVLQKICADGSGGLWIFSPSAGLGRFDIDTKTVQAWRNESPDWQRIATAPLQACLTGPQGRIWLASQEDLAFFDPEARSLQIVSTHEAPVDIPLGPSTSLHRDRRGLLWLGTEGHGLRGIDPNQNRFYHWRSHHRSMVPTAVLVDGTGRRWIGTLEHGLWRLPTGEETFSMAAAERVDSEGALDHILALKETKKGDILIGTDEGLWILGVEDRGRPPAEAIIRRAYARDGTDPGQVSVTSIELDSRGWWLGTFGDGLFHLGETTREFFPNQYTPGEHSSGFILDLATDAKGDLLVGTVGAGLLKKDAEDNLRHLDLPGMPRTITDLQLDPLGTWWVGTESSGLLRRLPDGGWTLWTEKDGLASNNVQAILLDSQGGLWISGDRGLSYLEKNAESFLTFNRLDGLSSNEFVRGGAVVDPPGRLAFLDRGGILQLHPENFDPHPAAPPIVLVAAEVDGDPLAQLPGENSPLILQPHQRTFTLEFSALDFSNPHKNLYSYRLEGYDHRWSAPSTNRRVSWTNLPGGQYTLRMKAAGASGTWGEREYVLAIDIRPPFWRTLWFRLLVLASAALLAYGLSLWRIRSLVSRRKKLTEIVAQKTEDLRLSNEKKEEVLGVVAHDLRNPITAFSGWTELAMEELKEGNNPKAAITFLERSLASSTQAGKLLNTLLDYSAIESGKINLRPEILELEPLLKSIVIDHQLLANPKGIHLELAPASGSVFVRADPLRLSEILSNLLSNAIKFTWPQGQVNLHYEVREAMVWIHVNDNGQGLTAEELANAFEQIGALSAKPTAGEPSHGFGLAIVKKLVHLHGGELRVSGEKDQGCTFSFSVPLAERDERNSTA